MTKHSRRPAVDIGGQTGCLDDCCELCAPEKRVRLPGCLLAPVENAPAVVRTTSIPEVTGVRVIHTLALRDGHCDADLLTNRVPGIGKKRPMMCLLAVARFH